MQAMESAAVMGHPTGQHYDELRKITGGVVAKDRMDAAQVGEMLGNEERRKYYPTGIPQLDSILRIEDGHFVVIGGESSSGKTSLVNQIMVEQLERKHGVCYFNLETDQKTLGRRFVRHIQSRFGIGWNAAREKYSSYGANLGQYNLVTDANHIIDEVHTEMRIRENLKFVVVDYLQIVECSDTYNETDATRLIATKLHRLARETGLIVIALCQLNKENLPGTKETKRFPPTMQSIRGHSSIANAANVILINWLPEDSKDREVFSVTTQVVKQKEGRRGAAAMALNGPFYTFIDPIDDPRNMADDDAPSYGNGPTRSFI